MRTIILVAIALAGDLIRSISSGVRRATSIAEEKSDA
jgi:hypothetical protein